jgi:hypothetical protein
MGSLLDDKATADDKDTALVEEEYSFGTGPVEKSPSGPSNSRAEWWRECKEMFNLAAPTAIGNLLEYLPVCTAMAVVGGLPGEEGKVTFLLDSPPELTQLFVPARFIPKKPRRIVKYHPGRFCIPSTTRASRLLAEACDASTGNV